MYFIPRCDIWLHESLGEFVSEFGFANDSIPISVATFSRESKPDIISISNIYEDNSHTFNPFQKTQGHPDVAECLDSTPLLLRIVLDGKYNLKWDHNKIINSKMLSYIWQTNYDTFKKMLV